MVSWQDNLTSRGSRLTHIFKTGDISDVTFVVGDEEGKRTFKLHKMILSMSSDVFYAMFYGLLSEKDEVRIPDIQPDIFEIAMKYLYEDSFSVQSMEQAMYTYSVAEKYNIVHLRKLCIKYMTENIDPETIPILYEMPSILDILEVKRKCQTILSEKAMDILESGYFVKYPSDLVKDMIQLDDLDIKSEEVLFKSVIKWAMSSSTIKNANNPMKTLRTVMKNFLPHIRFLAMSVKEFLSGPVNSGILTDSEIVSISENLLVAGCRELPSWCNEKRLRCAMHSFHLMENHVCKLGPSDQNTLFCLIYMRRGNIIFRGFSLYVSPNASFVVSTKNLANPSVSLSIIFITNGNETAINKFTTSYDPKTFQLKCILLEPFFLKPLPNKYKISITLQNFFLNLCQFPRFGPHVRTLQDFELEWYDLTCYYERPNLLTGTYVFPHFNEIFYS